MYKQLSRSMHAPAVLLAVISGYWNLRTDGPASFISQPDHATLPYIRKAVRKLAKWAGKNRINSVALPKIGAGLGKLSWEAEIKPLFIEHLSDSATRYVVYEIFRNEFEAH
jgi:O-acetyl-ADP-ribose deacetylase (regulator of RNase III)